MNYELSDIPRALRNPSLIRGEIRKFALKFNKWYHHKYVPVKGTEVMDENWDNLIILDGCRYDTFADVNSIEGTLELRTSRGGSSWEFMSANFEGRELHDTVYVTANPFEYRLSEGTFHAVINILDEWDQELQTVHPSSVLSSAEAVVKEYPNKRYIFHFMQPHYPFIGGKGRELDHRGYKRDQENPELDEPNIWDVLQWGYREYFVTEQQVREAYRENLEIVLGYVDNLLELLDGRSIITADHGNLIGDRIGPIPVRAYGHPEKLRSPELVEVPWHIVESESRREIQAEPPVALTSHDESEIENRLAALGYK